MRIGRVFLDTHMGKNFAGLLKIAHKAGLKPEAEKESYLVFVNAKRTKFKLLVSNTYLIYHDNGNRRIPLDAIKFMPKAFVGSEFVFDRAVKELLTEQLRPSA